MTQLPRISASKITRYLSCKSDYVSRYLLGMRPTVETTWSIFGTACHSAIQAGYEGTGFPFSVAEKVISDKFSAIDDIPHVGYSRADVLRKTYAVLDSFDYDLFSPAQMELEFLLPFTANGEVLCEIHGFIDMYTTDNRVIDFKTNSKAPSQKEVNCSVQLALYAWAIWKMRGEWPNEVAIYHLNTSRLIKADIYSLRDRLFDIEALIREMIVLDKDTPIETCKNCSPFCALKDWGNSGN